MSPSLPMNVPVTVRHDGKNRAGTVRGRSHPVGRDWRYDILLESGEMLADVAEDRVQAKVQE